jgi:hypothetical protein
MALQFLSSAAFAGCAGGVKPSANAPSNVNDSPEKIVVRMATDGEFATIEDDGLRKHCARSGAAMTGYYAPVVAFAREHFIKNIHLDGLAVHDVLAVPGAQDPALPDGVDIVVDPRDTVGELRIVSVGGPDHDSGKLWSESGYCLHVLRGGGTTTIAVQDWWRFII